MPFSYQSSRVRLAVPKMLVAVCNIAMPANDQRIELARDTILQESDLTLQHKVHVFLGGNLVEDLAHGHSLVMGKATLLKPSYDRSQVDPAFLGRANRHPIVD